MMQKHLTRYDSRFGSYNGWRFCMRRMGQSLVRYFSDLEFGGANHSHQKALAYRNRVYEQLTAHPENEADVLRQLNEELQRERKKRELAGHLQSTALPPKARTGFTLNLTPQLDTMLRFAGQQLGLDFSSVIRLALNHYLPAIQRVHQRFSQEELQVDPDIMESLAAALGLPSFDELMRKKNEEDGTDSQSHEDNDSS